MQKRRMKRALSFMLAFCLLVGLLPCIGGGAFASASDAVTVTSEADLKKALEDAAANPDPEQETVLKVESLEIDSPIEIPDGKKIKICSASKDPSTIKPSIASTWESSKVGLFVLGKGAKLHLEDITIDGGEKARCILVNEGNSELTLTNVTIQNGASTQYSGVAIHCSHPSGSDPNTINIGEGCAFINNKTSTTSPTSGGAIYIGKDCTAILKGGPGEKESICFSGNKAHSGACIYAYKAYVYAEHCQFGGAEVGNVAGQRGGALHCHGTMVLKDCTITNNSSGQYGGGIYISASAEDYDGITVLDNTSITNNTGENGGGGVFLASGGALFLRNRSSVTGNQLSSTLMGYKGDRSNVYYSGDSGMIIACDDTLGAVGISTVSPTYRKLSVYSLGTADDAVKVELNKRLAQLQEWYSFDVDTSFIMADLPMPRPDPDAAPPDKGFYYDGDAWELMDIKNDRGAASKGEQYTKGNLWLNLRKKYIIENTGGETIIQDQPYVVFDYNLPGMKADVYPSKALGSELKVGSKIHAPQVPSVIRKSGVEFTFLGWSTQPEGGETFPGGTEVTVKEGHQVYYAQWDFDIPQQVNVPDLFTVFFDYNYPGGGVTSALVGTIDVTIEVEVTASGSSESGSVSATETVTQNKTISIPFDAPTPSRLGYRFMGWSTSPNDSIGSNPPVPPKSSTTYYAIWEARPCTITWDANGGTGGSQITQAYDEAVIPPDQVPTRTGYRFTGWYIDSGCTVPLTSGTLVQGNATFYAGWTPKEYTITWDANYTGGTVTTIKQYHDEKLNILPKPVRDGYSFGGWYTQPNGAGTRAESYGTVREDVTFYAIKDR